MIEPANRVLDSPGCRHLRRRRTAQQDDGETEPPRRRDLAVGRGTAAVLGDDHLDRVADKQSPIVRFAERPATGDIERVRYRKRRINGLDAAHEIMMLRRPREDSNLAFAEREKHMSRRVAQRLQRRRGIGDFDPSVAAQRRPWSAPQCEQGNARGRGGGGRVRGDDFGVGVRRVDESVDALIDEISREALGPAEAADAHPRGLRGGRRGTPGERDRYGEIGTSGETFREPSRFRSAAEDEDASHVGC